jgi:hypothetical protein
MRTNRIAIAAALLVAPGLLNAQFDFKLFNRDVQIHSFASQGFAYSNDNNYLTMKTSQGSLAMTDGGANISTHLTDKLRIGAQIYLRNVGALGGWHPVLDWGFADYKFNSWFGLRGGKVKTTLGLFNDSQDQESLHTWALLPQSVYALDVRGARIAHTGGDAYGGISLKRFGHLDYTVYGGARNFDRYGGYPYDLHTVYTKGSSQFNVKQETGTVIGEDLRWSTPLKGLMIGASHATYTYQNASIGDPGNAYAGYSSARASNNYTNAFYFDYSTGNLRLYGEYQRYLQDYKIYVGSAANPIMVARSASNQRMGYAAISYRISKRLELGTYHSRFIAQWSQPHSATANHLFDQTVTGRIDLTRHWDLKVEGHFMDGAPTGSLDLRGFYPIVNPGGIAPTTKMLVIRTGWAF